MKQQKFILSTIIVTWQSENYIEGCLTSLLASTSSIKSQIIVVDNNSSDNTCKIIRKKFPIVTLLPQEKNWGFGQGNNIGIKKTTSKYILLLNPDTKVNKRAIYTMLKFMQTNGQAGAVGPEQINEHGNVIATLSHTSLATFSNVLYKKISKITGGGNKIIFKKPLETSMLNLGAVMLKRDIFDLGIFFDPNIFLYGEEPDFFTRIKKTGWKIYFLPNIYVYHYREKSIALTGKKYVYVIESVIHLLKKYTNGFVNKYRRI